MSETTDIPANTQENGLSEYQQQLLTLINSEEQPVFPSRYDTVYYPGAGRDLGNLLRINATNYVLADIGEEGEDLNRFILSDLDRLNCRVITSANDEGSSTIEVRFNKPNDSEVKSLQYHYQTDAVDGFPTNLNLITYTGFFPLLGVFPIEWKIRFFSKIPADCYLQIGDHFEFPDLFGLKLIAGHSGHYQKSLDLPDEHLRLAFGVEQGLKNLSFDRQELRHDMLGLTQGDTEFLRARIADDRRMIEESIAKLPQPLQVYIQEEINKDRWLKDVYHMEEGEFLLRKLI